MIAFHKICTIYHLLAARFLVIVTPSQFPFTHQTIDNVKDCLQRLQEQDIQAVWEIRTPHRRLPRSVIDVMRDFDIVHCVDLTNHRPLYPSTTLYTRLFGRGHHNVYQFTNQELAELDKTIETVEGPKPNKLRSGSAYFLESLHPGSKRRPGFQCIAIVMCHLEN